MLRDKPKQGELVIATIKKILPYGAFCSLDEYNNMEAFLHVSEIAPRWIKNIHEHIKEGQKVIALVHRVIPDKNQIDLSLKRVTEADKVWKRDQYRKTRRAVRLLELAAKKLRRSPTKFVNEVGGLLEEKFGSVYAGLESLSFDPDNAVKKLEGLSERVVKALLNVARENIKKSNISITRVIQLEVYEPNGIELIKGALLSLEIPEDVKVDINYLGAPKYRFVLETLEYKRAEKVFESILEQLKSNLKGHNYKIEVLNDK